MTMTNNKCPICSLDASKEFRDGEPADGEVYSFVCRRCGAFDATKRFLDIGVPTLSPQQLACASGWVREHEGITLEQTGWEMLRSLNPPSVGEKADKLLMFLARTHPAPGAPLALMDKQDNLREELLARCWAQNEQEVRYLFYDYLKGNGRVIGEDGRAGPQIAPKGWDYLHRLRSVNPDSQIGFCALWFHESMDPVWDRAIKLAVTDSGYHPVRIDQHLHNNRIDDEIIAKIRQSRFVVADFTHGKGGSRGGVYFEAGFALGLGLSVIHTCRADMIKKVHFDNRQYNFVVWREGKLDEFRRALQNRIEATIGRGKMLS